MKIAIVAGSLPPRLDGIGDYSAMLAAELARSATVTIYCAEPAHPAAIPSVTIRQAFNPARPQTVKHLRQSIADDVPDWLLLQYNPFIYGRRGFNPFLPLTLRAIKKDHPGVRLAVMIHEPFVPVLDLKHALMTSWQRWQLRHLAYTADLLLCSISAWAKMFGRWFPHVPVVHVPVGSNIPYVKTSRAEARANLSVDVSATVLGVFGSLHSSYLVEWVARAAHALVQEGRRPLVLYVGPTGRVLQAALGGVPLQDVGALPAEAVSRTFAAMDVMLLPYSDGISTRRTTLMSALQHGLPVAGTMGHLTDPVLSAANGSALLLADVTAQDEFVSNVKRLCADPQLRASISQAGQEMYYNNFSWPHISRKFLDEMRLAAEYPRK